jgi:hypothetical protein
MKLNMFLMIATVVAAVFGLAFLFVPAEFVALYGPRLNPAGVVVGRIAGSTILAFAIVYWGARNSKGAEALKAVLVAACISNGLDALIMLHATWTGIVNVMGWSAVVINGLLAAGFAHFAWSKR